ncbi:DVU0524 family FlgM-associated protein [Desulfobacterium sp. N47]|uniref:Uncharacterized protein n=1 Tax=uncultured Desulfobacterium sp. TaxID=201089 RepID=E1YGW6_9BACT|nr:hypothetical protein N47_F15050 [uncultured Desulfobacterium sp.]
MVISAYQVNNVLRVYHDQLRNSRASRRQVNNSALSPDRVTISTNAKQKAVSDKIASSIANKINQYGTKDEIGNESLNKFEKDPEIQQSVSQNIPADLVFKMIDDDGETIKMFNIEDIKHSDNSAA